MNDASVLGKAIFLGAGVTVDPSVHIVRFCKVASGVTVKKNIDDGSLVFYRESEKHLAMFDRNGNNRFSKISE